MRAGHTREKSIEERVRDWAIARGWLNPKVKFAEAGYPDRIYVGFGVTVWIEFKKPGEKVEPGSLQEYRINELRKRGANVIWTDSFEAAIGYLQGFMGPARLPDPRDKAAHLPSRGRTVP
jgi:hypothetical protein